MRLVNKKEECILKLEDKTSGELFAKCPIDKYPGVAIEAVTDSSRYFVLRIQDEEGIVMLLIRLLGVGTFIFVIQVMQNSCKYFTINKI